MLKAGRLGEARDEHATLWPRSLAVATRTPARLDAVSMYSKTDSSSASTTPCVMAVAEGSIACAGPERMLAYVVIFS